MSERDSKQGNWGRPRDDRRGPPLLRLPDRELRVIPERWMPRGEVETQWAGRPLMVWQGIPGEKALVKVEHQGLNQILGRWVGSPEPHPHRVEPVCDKYTTCGGCPLMHLDAHGQADARRQLVRAGLDQAGLSDVRVGEFHKSPGTLREFRHIIKVAVGYADSGRIRVGAWGRRNRHVIPIPDCHVATPGLRKVMAAFAHHVIDMNIHPFDAVTGQGVLRVAVMRASRSTGEVLVTLVAGRHVRELDELAERLASSATNVAGVWLHINDGPGNAIFTRGDSGVVGVTPLVGKPTIDEVQNGISYKVGSGDFFQTNPALAEILSARTIEALRLEPGNAFVDLYCGVGGLALQGARVSGWALGVEEVDGAVARAKEAARFNKIQAEFTTGKVEDVLPEIAKRLAGRSPILSVNPARRGLEPGVVEAIVALKPRRIAYISCNPRAMGRDLALFREAGFEIGEVEMFDMFPNTAHVECLVILEGAPDTGDARRGPQRRLVGASSKT